MRRDFNFSHKFIGATVPDPKEKQSIMAVSIVDCRLTRVSITEASIMVGFSSAYGVYDSPQNTWSIDVLSKLDSSFLSMM